MKSRTQQGAPAPRVRLLRTAADQKGIALVVTLIMLAVITFLAIAFLVLSNHERGSVTTTTDQTISKFAAESAEKRAESEILASFLALTNDQAVQMIVSTNYINPLGFNTGLPPNANRFANVNYSYPNGTNLNAADLRQNIANLLYNPRPPVFIVTNVTTGAGEWRAYLDLNRNGRFDPNGYLIETNRLGQPVIGTNGLPVTNYFVGDPEWIGIPQHPDWPISASNQFVSRIAYLVVPTSDTLDINHIGNQARGQAISVTGPDRFVRNEGVGPWEINLPAFLADLNTNIWETNTAPYFYLQPNGNPNRGVAFDDARLLLNYRYGSSYNSLMSMTALFGAAGANALRNQGIDRYSDGSATLQLMTGTTLPSPELDPVQLPWVGADNTNQFFTTQELFDRNKTAFGLAPNVTSFSDRLKLAGLGLSSYDRYTYYRLLSQLGTDSQPEPRMNLNYCNVDASGNVVPGMEMQLLQWQPLQFFTNAANRLLRAQFPDLNLSVTNIPVFLNNQLVYSSSVNRLLQLAANMYEATTNSPYPCIYRPYFSSPDGTNIIIRGYELVNGPDSLPTDPSLLTIPIDLNDSTSRSQITSNVTFVNVYGVPWIIGAKKGFANFNQASLQTVSTMTRKIQVTRPIDNGGSIRNGYHYKQMLLLSVSSRVAVGVWNSYQTNYPNATQIPIPAREVYIQADGIFSGALTNTAGPGVTAAKYNVGGPSPAPRGSITLAASTWKGTGVIPGTPGPAATTSFQVPLLADLEVVPNSMWLGGSLVPVPTNAVAQWDLVPSDSYPQANWVLTVTNNLRCMIFDGGSAGSGRLVDYVQLAGPSTLRPLSQEVQTRNFEKGLGGIWSTNIATGISGGATPQGVIDQIGISLGDPATTDTDWINNVVGYQPGSKDNEIAGFSAFFYTKQVSTNTAQVPFTPTAERSQIISWQANDPLVHYTGDDLTYAAVGQNLEVVQPPGRKVTSLETNLYRYNDRYDPWGGVPGKGSSGDPNALSMAVKDPLVRSSDDWNFPTNKLPNIGWLGRFHRGTPWQTVYLKSSQTDLKAWTNWTGNINLFVARSSMPVNDRLLFDQFTTGINDNANRGQLPINVASAYASGDPLAGLAAWSAVLSGVITLTNTGATVQPIVIDPAAVDTRNGISSPRVARIVAGINRTRANTDVKAGPVFRNGVFNHIGDVLAVPELTERSPFLNTNFISGAAANAPDEVVERIPQQILSLLTVNHTPRFVVYAYGQTLHPANNSIVTSGQFSGLCTNYQITAETATRAVVRVEGTPDPRFADTIVKGEIQHHPDEFGRTYPPHLVIESFNVLPPD